MKKINFKYIIGGALSSLILMSCNNVNTNIAPSVQVEFETSRNKFYNSYESAPNEIKKSAIFIQSRLNTCEFEKKYGRSFKDWVGVIDDILTDQGGDEITIFRIKSEAQGRTIYYEATSIKKDSTLYNKIAEFKEGDNVYFSFVFNEEAFSTNEKECFDESSLTELGSLDEPEFNVTYTNVKIAK